MSADVSHMLKVTRVGNAMLKIGAFEQPSVRRYINGPKEHLLEHSDTKTPLLHFRKAHILLLPVTVSSLFSLLHSGRNLPLCLLDFLSRVDSDLSSPSRSKKL